MTKFPKIDDMQRNDWIELITVGMNKGVVKVVDSDQLEIECGTQGIVCSIGNNAFYFAEDGMDYEDEDGLSRYLKDHTREEIIEQIADSIIDMQKDYANTTTKEEKEELGEACPECFYYYLYIIDALSDGKEVILPIC